MKWHIQLDPKDQPVLLAAIHGKADYLLTGDARHFGHLYGKRIEGLLVLWPAAYLSAGDGLENAGFAPLFR
jgi:predicted nucleic acid-binding protein